MNTENDTRSEPSKKTRVDEAIATLIEDLRTSGQLSDEQLKAVTGGATLELGKITVCSLGGLVCKTYEANSSTANNDVDSIQD
jgi:hypothetical protein